MLESTRKRGVRKTGYSWSLSPGGVAAIHIRVIAALYRTTIALAGRFLPIPHEAWPRAERMDGWSREARRGGAPHIYVIDQAILSRGAVHNHVVDGDLMRTCSEHTATHTHDARAATLSAFAQEVGVSVI